MSLNYRTATAAEIAARIQQITEALTATTGYSPAIGITHFTASGDRRRALEDELGRARYAFLPIAQAREVTA
jgi:hypothetical protein